MRLVAQLERERVDDVLAGRGRAPGVVAPTAELDVEVDPDERRPLGVDPGAVRGRRRVHALLHQDLRVEVGDLRAGDEQRMAALRFRAGHEQRVRGAGREAGEEPAGRGRLGELQRAGVGSGDALGAGRLVREALLQDRHGRLGILGGAEVLERGRPSLLPEARLERVGELRELQLLAAALAEDPAHERSRGDDVGGLERLRDFADGGVLAGQLGGVELGLEDVLVDAGQVVLGIRLDLLALLAEVLGQVVDLSLEVLLVVRRDRPRVGVHRRVRSAREARQLGPAGVTQDVHEEQPVLGADVPEPEHRARAGLAVDVRDAEALVAHHGDVLPR